MRERSLKASSCNNRIRAVNAYLKWSGSSLTVNKLKEEQRVLPTFGVKDISKFIEWKPRNIYEKRLQTLVLMLRNIQDVVSMKF